MDTSMKEIPISIHKYPTGKALSHICNSLSEIHTLGKFIYVLSDFVCCIQY